MKLYQLLRHIKNNVHIKLCDLQEVEICKVDSKVFISTDLYEYDLFSIDLVNDSLPGVINANNYYLQITIQK